MNLDILKAIAEELNELLCNGFVNQIHQPLPREIILSIRKAGAGEQKLVLSADPQLGRIHTTYLKIPNPPRPPKFCAYLRAHFKGARIQEILCARTDRVVTLETSYGPRDDPKIRLLKLELLGRDSNIILINGSDNTIMDCMRRIPDKGFGNRIVLPFAPYEPPPSKGGTIQVPATHEKAPIRPGVTRDNKGRRRLTLNADPGSHMVFDSMNHAAGELYNGILSHKLLEASRRELMTLLTRKRKGVARRIENVKRDMERLERMGEFRETGELLKANLHRVKKGAGKVEVFDWGSNRNREIQLDPALSPVENMEKMFKKAGKSKRGEGVARGRLDEAERELAALEDLLFLVERADNRNDLDMIQEEISPDKDKDKKTTKKERGQKNFIRAVGWEKIQAPVSGVIYVGKSAKGNDELLRTKAQKGDLWFHAKDAPGAHVLLTNRTGKDPDPKDIEFAARLALDHSRVGSDSKHEVMMADVKDVRKVKGSPFGQVRVDRSRTVHARGRFNNDQE